MREKESVEWVFLFNMEHLNLKVLSGTLQCMLFFLCQKSAEEIEKLRNDCCKTVCLGYRSDELVFSNSIGIAKALLRKCKQF